LLIARGARLKHERSEGFKDSRTIRNAQFTQKLVTYNILLFETTSVKLQKIFKMVSHLLLRVLTARNVTLNVFSGNGSLSAHLVLGRLRGSLQMRKMRIYDSSKQ
jgi:hypothetical protein